MREHSGRITTISIAIAIFGIITLILLSITSNNNQFYTRDYNWKADGSYGIRGDPKCKSKNIYKEGVRYKSKVQPVWRYDTSGRWGVFIKLNISHLWRFYFKT